MNKEAALYLPLMLFAMILQDCFNHKYTILELRHECSDMNRAIVRPLWSSVVFRLREPIYEKCKGKLSSAIFRWKFNMIRKKPCRGMIGCHNLESRYDKVTKQRVFDFEGLFTFISLLQNHLNL